VTECRRGDEFISQQEVLEVIEQYIEEPAHKLVENAYKYFERLQDFQLRDDFTLVAIRQKSER